MFSKKFMQSLVVAALACAFVTPVSAAVSYTVENGNLMSAQGINVGGSLYDVEFLDGRFIDLFPVSDLRQQVLPNGQLIDFYYTFQDPFDTYEEIKPFGQALLDQVFIDTPQYALDSDPTLINGCSDSNSCEVLIPINSGVTTVSTFNSATDTTVVSFQTQVGDFVVQSGVDPVYPTDQFNHRTFAKFTQQSVSPVPEAPNLALLAVGSLLLLGMRRKSDTKVSRD